MSMNHYDACCSLLRYFVYQIKHEPKITRQLMRSYAHNVNVALATVCETEWFPNSDVVTQVRAIWKAIELHPHTEDLQYAEPGTGDHNTVESLLYLANSTYLEIAWAGIRCASDAIDTTLEFNPNIRGYRED